MIFEITLAAQADLIEIYQFSKTHWDDERARRYANDLRRRLKLLALGQVSGQAVDYVAPGLRNLPCGTHVLWFRRETGRILVIRVLHQSRDVARWIGDEG